MIFTLGFLGFPGWALAETPAVPAQAVSHYLEGKRLLCAGRETEAKAQLLKAIELAPRYVEAHRLYQQAAIHLCEIRPIVEKYDQLLRAAPNDPMLLYLNGRLRTDPQEQKDLFSKAVALGPAFPWGHFGMAHVAMRNQDPSQAVKIYRKAIALWGEQSSIGFSGLGIAYLREGRNEEAAAAFQRATALDPEDGSAWLLRARALARLNRPAEALRSAVSAIQSNPESGEAHDFCRTLLVRHGTCSDFQAAAEICRRAIASHTDSPESFITLALALHHAGDLSGALENYEKARSLGASPSDYANDLRLLYVRLRQYSKAYQTWQEKAPADLIFFQGNVAQQRFQRVADATQEAEKAHDSPAAQLELAAAYEGAGWLDEALVQYELVCSLAAVSEKTEAQKGRERILRHQEFCKRIRALFEENYFNFASGKRTMSTSAAVRRVHKLAAEVLSSPVVGETKILSYTFLGEVTDYRYPPASGLQKYFWQFNQFFAIGRPLGEPVQCVLMNVISWEPNRQALLWGRPLIHDRLVGENAGVRGSQEVISDVHVGGQTVYRFYYVDIDRVWESASGKMEVMPKLGDRIRAAANEAPQPSDPLKVRYLSCVPEILRWQGMSSMTSGRHNDDNDLRRRIFAETLSDIDAHEQGHVLDGLSYAPVGAHLLDDLLLIFKYGFSPKALMAMTERNAQLTALAHAKEPRFILAAALSYVARDVELTQHARGYFDLVQSFVHYLNAHSKEFPEIDPRKRLLDQFPRLSPEQIHQLAPSVAQEEGLPQRAARVLKESRP